MNIDVICVLQFAIVDEVKWPPGLTYLDNSYYIHICMNSYYVY